MSWPILSVTVFLPLAGALFIMMLRGEDAAVDNNARWVALWTTLITFAISLLLVWRFDATSSEFQFVERHPWLGGTITYHMGVDGISLPFVILTTGLLPLCIIASFESVRRRVKEYMIAFLVLETLMVGTFCALDLVLFYLFFEGGLIPMFLIIGIWGGPRRVYASFKFFLYTFLGSVLMLLAIMAMYWSAGTTDIATLLHHEFPRSLQTWAWFAFLASFAVKLPMWPVHTWLPDAHVEAPTAGSVILAAILLKLGGYGFLRFSVPMFPLASQEFAPLIFALSIVAIIYTSLVAMVQQDMKKLIAYSSVAHMGFVTMGIFAGTLQGIAGGIFQMISHGLVSGALFLCVGVVYDRMHTREIAAYGGLVNRMPLYAAVFMVFTLANVGLPGTTGFIGEFLSLLGTFQINTWVATLATTGLILSACYALWLYRQIIFGVIDKASLAHILDLSRREIIIFSPLIALTILFGIYPKPVLDMSAASVTSLLETYQHATSNKSAVRTPAPDTNFPVGAVEMLPARPDNAMVKIRYLRARSDAQHSHGTPAK
jgi:NADH-quinone oxidoreductase subunit M